MAEIYSKKMDPACEKADRPMFKKEGIRLQNGERVGD
jgi:hypothetical protein